MNKILDKLYDSLQKRLRPEDVAEMILALLKDNLLDYETLILKKATSNSLKNQWHQFTSMSQDFRRPVPPVRQSRKAHELFAAANELSDADCADVEKVSELVSRISGEIFKKTGKNSFKYNRLNNETRALKGLIISRRKYNKLFRFLTNFERKIETYKLEIRKYQAGRIAKSSLATSITYGDFTDSVEAACFIAYFTARSNRRSVFTNQSQERPFDEVAKMLFNRFKRNPTEKGWRAISLVTPDIEVIDHLSDKDKFELFTRWLTILDDIGELLKLTWVNNRFYRKTMIVKRGDDSSTWNALAGAWNFARQGYLSVIHGLGLEHQLDEICFGKVLRLMAADVAYWHKVSGGELESDTLVWAELPLPWEVFSGEAVCTRRLVEIVCQKHGVDPVKKGWTSPRGSRQEVPFKPTPELVHGVAVSNPHLAFVLQKAGWFSGQKMKEPIPDSKIRVERDAHGFAMNVTVENDE